MTQTSAPVATPPTENSRPQQQEMPLAMVLGQPVLQIPQDLYIPPDALEIILDAFGSTKKPTGLRPGPPS